MLNEVRKDLTEAENYELNKFILLTANAFEKAEHKFLDLVFGMGDQEGMSLPDAKSFISYLVELRLFQLGLATLEDVRKNPLDWIDYILSATTHTSFFEARVVDYNHNGLHGEVNSSKWKKYLL